jgi:hypothetical protein
MAARATIVGGRACVHLGKNRYAPEAEPTAQVRIKKEARWIFCCCVACEAGAKKTVKGEVSDPD